MGSRREGDGQYGVSSDALMGPTPCDEARESRGYDIDAVWNGILLAKAGECCLPRTHLLLAGGLDLFREALSCYQNSAFQASVLMCGVAIETTVYLALTRRASGMEHGMPAVLEISKGYTKEKWNKILRDAIEEGYVSGDLVNDIKTVREWRNRIAHFGQKSDSDEDVEKITRRLSDEDSSSFPWAPPDRGKALEVLKMTAEILAELVRKTCEEITV